MEEECLLCEDGLEKYPVSGIVIGNLIFLAGIGVGTVACWLLHPIAGVIYLILALLMAYVVMRKLVCTNCYYYGKWCALGWGKLAALLFKQGDVSKFASSPGVKLAPLTYGLIMGVPVILIIISSILDFAWYKIAILALLILYGFYSGAVSRGRSCARCKMKLVCPGNSAKEAKG